MPPRVTAYRVSYQEGRHEPRIEAGVICEDCFEGMHGQRLWGIHSEYLTADVPESCAWCRLRFTAKGVE
jgi:hypothetical protein